MGAPLLLPHELAPIEIFVPETAKTSKPTLTRVLPPIQLPALIRPADPQLLISIFDDSGSITGGNDPVGWRYEEIAAALRHFAKSWRGIDVLTAVRHFDVGTSVDVGPCRFDRRGLVRLTQGLKPPPEVRYGTSDLAAALEGAYELAEAHPQYVPVLIVLSDYELTDGNVARVLQRLGEFGELGEVHAVVLCSEPPTVLESDPRVGVTHVTWSSPHGAVARAICNPFRSTSYTRPKRGPKGIHLLGRN